MEKISENKSFGGLQTVWEHQSDICSCPMRFAVYTPPALADGSADKPVPVLWWLSGLTCTEENFTVKSGFQRYAAEHGLMVVAPDTSPRGLGLRCQRFAMVVEDGTVKSIEIDAAGAFEKTSAESVLASL